VRCPRSGTWIAATPDAGAPWPINGEHAPICSAIPGVAMVVSPTWKGAPSSGTQRMV